MVSEEKFKLVHWWKRKFKLQFSIIECDDELLLFSCAVFQTQKEKSKSVDVRKTHNPVADTIT